MFKRGDDVHIGGANIQINYKFERKQKNDNKIFKFDLKKAKNQSIKMERRKAWKTFLEKSCV